MHKQLKKKQKRDIPGAEEEGKERDRERYQELLFVSQALNNLKPLARRIPLLHYAPPLRLYQGSIKALSRLYQGSIKALSMLYQGSIKAASRQHQGGITCTMPTGTPSSTPCPPKPSPSSRFLSASANTSTPRYSSSSNRKPPSGQTRKG